MPHEFYAALLTGPIDRAKWFCRDRCIASVARYVPFTFLYFAIAVEGEVKI